MSIFNFEISYKDFKARVGKITTPHGDIDTPNFISCGTKAVMKGITAKQLTDAGCQIFLSNTYHLETSVHCLHM